MEDAQGFNYISEIKPFPSIKVPLQMMVFRNVHTLYLNHIFQSDSFTSFSFSMKGIVTEIMNEDVLQFFLCLHLRILSTA